MGHLGKNRDEHEKIRAGRNFGKLRRGRPKLIVAALDLRQRHDESFAPDIRKRDLVRFFGQNRAGHAVAVAKVQHPVLGRDSYA